MSAKERWLPLRSTRILSQSLEAVRGKPQKHFSVYSSWMFVCQRSFIACATGGRIERSINRGQSRFLQKAITREDSFEKISSLLVKMIAERSNRNFQNSTRERGTREGTRRERLKSIPHLRFGLRLSRKAKLQNLRFALKSARSALVSAPEEGI
jgi:hypothetical protein